MSNGTTESTDPPLAEAQRMLESDPAMAVAALQNILRSTPAHEGALRLLARALRSLGQDQPAAQAELKAIEASACKPALRAAIGHMAADRLAESEAILRPHLAREPDDVTAICLLGEIANRVGIYAEAENLFRRALELAPDFPDAKVRLAKVFFQQNRTHEATRTLDEVLAFDAGHVGALTSKLTMLGQIGEYDQAIDCYRELIEHGSTDAMIWTGYANVLKTVGRSADSVDAYRHALDLDPGLGESWWGLANLKTVILDHRDIATMADVLATPGIDDNRALHLHFALGKAFEDAGRYRESFEHYDAGNRLRRRALPYDAEANTRDMHRSIALFTPEFLAEHDRTGSKRNDPIFILGMPRAGSTLVEQILSSHPEVEGTSELPDIPLLIHQMMADRWRDRHVSYPELLRDLSHADLFALGEHYLRSTAQHRKTDRPFFIDKLPNNWAYIGFIHLILPNAKIIDARREAMACCFSNFKQHFARGQAFSYSLTDMGRYYRDYVALLDHFDQMLPGRVRRVQHEALIDDPEREVRALLDDLGLPFDPACLRFHENQRPVRTASSEQVRRPITRDAVDRWKDYLPWLGDLRTALSPGSVEARAETGQQLILRHP